MSHDPHETVAKVAEQGGAGVAFFSGLMKWLGQNHDAIASLGVICGIAIGVAGFVVNWYYQRKRSQAGKQ